MEWTLNRAALNQPPERGQWQLSADGESVQMVCPQCNPPCVDTKELGAVIMVNKAMLVCPQCSSIVLCTLEGYPIPAA